MKNALALLISFAFLAGCTTIRPKTCQFKSVGQPDGVESEDIACVMNATVAPQARRCYEDLLTASPSLEFRIEQKFEISPAGQAEKITYDTDIETSSFGVCMTNALKSATFPFHTSAKPVTVSYPWRFKRAHL